MREFLCGSSYFCVALTVGAFCIGSACQKKWRLAILNPILIGAGIVALTLLAFDIPVERYQENCRIISYLITPATICLAISFAEQLQTLKRHIPAIVVGVLAGSLCSIGSIAIMAKALGLSDALTNSLLPKSVTTAIGVVLSEQAGGIGALTTAAIIITGVLGNMAGPFLSKLFRLKDPVAQGVAYGTASHVVGTSRAISIDPLTGAVSSLSLTLAGIVTSVVFSLFAV